MLISDRVGDVEDTERGGRIGSATRATGRHA